MQLGDKHPYRVNYGKDGIRGKVSLQAREWITARIDEGKTVQLACTYSNTCRWSYLTTSGRVCREEHGYIEDGESDETLDLRFISWSTCKRLQRALQNIQM
jgi:hypothetical protein